jgi:hypothetical protein
MIEAASLPVNYASVDHPTDVEQRLRRLETAVAALQDTQLMEERVAERIAQKTKRSPLNALRDTATVIVDASKALVPTGSASSTSNAPPTDKTGWLLIDLWSEVRTFGKMLFDHRYPFSYAGRFGPVIIACAYVFSWMFLGGIVGSILERLIDIVLAFVLYKIMSREVQRYRCMFPV